MEPSSEMDVASNLASDSDNSFILMILHGGTHRHIAQNTPHDLIVAESVSIYIHSPYDK